MTRCCLTPMVFREDGRLFCHCCGTTFQDVAYATTLTAGSPLAHRAETPAEVTARVLAYVKAHPSADVPTRRGRPPKVLEGAR